MKRNEIIKALECCLTLEYGVACKGCPLSYKDERRMDCLELLMKNALSLINELTEEKSNLEYTLMGVMHSVDKWLEGVELEQDEVNRAATMREKTLQIVEKLTEENERLLARNFDLAEKGEKVVIAYKKLSEENEKLLNHYFIDTTLGSGTSRQKCIEETVQNYRESLYRELASLGAKDKFNKEFFLTKADQIAKEMVEQNEQ